jgi:hypothetical protein
MSDTVSKNNYQYDQSPTKIKMDNSGKNVKPELNLENLRNRIDLSDLVDSPNFGPKKRARLLSEF